MHFFKYLYTFPYISLNTGACWGYLNCANNQLRNRFYNFVHLQLFEVKFLISENYIFRKQAIYERTCLVLDFKLTQENDDLLSSRHK